MMQREDVGRKVYLLNKLNESYVQVTISGMGKVFMQVKELPNVQFNRRDGEMRVAGCLRVVETLPTTTPETQLLTRIEKEPVMDMKVVAMATKMFFGWSEEETNLVVDFMKTLSQNRWNMSMRDFAQLRAKYPIKEKGKEL